MESPLLLLLLLGLAAAATGQLDFGGENDLPPLEPAPPVEPAPASPLTVFFEQEHYINKASEPGFCEYHCGSERRPVVVKPGRCPAVQPQPEYVCNDVLDQCVYDSECPGGQRCCSNGCARACVDPDLRRRCEDLSCPPETACVDRPPADAVCVSTVPHPGRCWAVQPQPENVCNDDFDLSSDPECLYDAECAPSQRCCSNGCVRVCVDPDLRRRCEDLSCPPETTCVDRPPADAVCVSTVPRPGLCPAPLPPGNQVSCDNTCSYDAECAAGDKCCHNGCAFRCLPPRKPGCAETKCKVGYKCEEDLYGNPECKQIPCEQDGLVVDIECNSCTCIQGFLLCAQEECPPTKEGFCPRIVKGYRGICQEQCGSDYDCPGEQKCCGTGCGHVCKQSIPEIVHPCRTVRFRCGSATHCAATRALCRPGETCPLVPLCVSNASPSCGGCPEGKVCILQKKACSGNGSCPRVWQPICIQLYTDDTIFQEDEEVETQVVAEQQARAADNSVLY